MSSVVPSFSSETPPASQRRVVKIALFLLGALILFFGVFFVIGGLELVWYGGSWYYLLCGPVLMAAGFFILSGKRLGAWLYLLALGGTFLWTLYEVGFQFWGWLPRLFGPAVIAVLVLAALPFLTCTTKSRFLKGEVS